MTSTQALNAPEIEPSLGERKRVAEAAITAYLAALPIEVSP